MLGRVKTKTDPNKDIIDTLAGPNPGLVDKAEYTLANGYPVITTQPGYGIGAIGYPTNCMTYNPLCCVGEDDNGDPIYKGVLRVNCVCADDIEGAGEGEFVKKNVTSDSVSHNLMLWANAEEAEHPGYYKAYQSSSYPLTYNPGTGWLCSRCQYSCCSCVASLTSSGVTLADNAVTLCGADLTLCKDGCVIGQFCSNGFNGKTNGDHIGRICAYSSNVSSWCNVPFISQGLTCLCYCGLTYNPSARTLRSDCFCAACMMSSVCCVVTPEMYWDGRCGKTYMMMAFNNGDTCSCICMSGDTANICAEDTCVCNLYVTSDAYMCNELVINCGTCFGYDWCMWYGICQQTACMYCDGTLYLGAICKNYCSCNENVDEAAGTCNWNGNRYVPAACEIRCYLYARCAVTAYSSGSTLFIRTQNCANWV